MGALVGDEPCEYITPKSSVIISQKLKWGSSLIEHSLQLLDDVCAGLQLERTPYSEPRWPAVHEA
ncbi:hypothetical protein M514_10277 [Trichuris suis]|uniref:Uncharacterized protein n=1 Tax=Trichuris suis TaxID=68888 RepID=A0A085LVB8_9BILA|nr:hypothetical protein M513_10277 [Trichuris suis]KFD60066.1 hypothetical protein M514_10277 [Trichuris suis]